MANYQYINATGVIVPDTADIKQAVIDEWRTAFGADLSVDDETPQGVLINAEVIARTAVIENNVALANQINPTIAGGVFLDAIGALTTFMRRPARHTTVEVTLTGRANILVPAGTALLSDTEDRFLLVNPLVLDGSGKGVGLFRAEQAGEVPVPARSLTTFAPDTVVLGLETAINEHEGSIGQDIQSDASYRTQRRVTLALQGRSLSEAITSNLSALNGVRSVAFRENTTPEPIEIEGITLAPHSIWCCVDGGLDQAIAYTLNRVKSAGAGYNGEQVIELIDEFSRQPKKVKFDRPEELRLKLSIIVRQGTAIANVQTAVRDAVMLYALGEQEGENGLQIGKDISPLEFANSINQSLPAVQILSIRGAFGEDDFSIDVLPVAINQVARLAQADIIVEVR